MSLALDDSKVCPNCQLRPRRRYGGWCDECTTRKQSDKRNEQRQALKLIESLIHVVEQDVRPRTPMQIAEWVFDKIAPPVEE